jgi:UDP-N-acetylglucosamine 4-epimerase
MSAYTQLQQELRATPRTWLVTGAGGFIGSNLVESLLQLGQHVTGLDNFATGRRENLDHVHARVTPEQWARLRFVEGDIRSAADCRRACEGVDYALHQGALGSVPRSIAEPFASHEANVTGTLNMMIAARDAKARRFVYASSSSVYGDHPGLPKFEDRLGQPLSPYAATKLMDEIYASVFARCYGLETAGLRYFNVFGPRQDPEGAYAAVIPKWVASMLRGQPVVINGDGETSRDFCYIANVVQANLLAATSANPGSANQAYNVAVGARTTLAMYQCAVPGLKVADPVYEEFRAGDVRHSLADITRAQTLLGYAPTHQIGEGLDEALEWYRANVA